MWHVLFISKCENHSTIYKYHIKLHHIFKDIIIKTILCKKNYMAGDTGQYVTCDIKKNSKLINLK